MKICNSLRNLQTLRANYSRSRRIKNAKFLGYCFYMNTNIQVDFQICISVPSKNLVKKSSNRCYAPTHLSHKKLQKETSTSSNIQLSSLTFWVFPFIVECFLGIGQCIIARIQRRIQNPVKHLRWLFSRKLNNFQPLSTFEKRTI